MGGRTWWLIMGAVLLIATACGGGSTDDGGDETGGEAPATTPTTEDTTTDAAEPATDSDTADDADTDAVSSDEADADDPDTDDDTADDTADEDADEDVAATIGERFGTPTSPLLELPALGPGDEGDDVVALQERLGELGFAPGTPDGSYGGNTVASVTAFQELVGLIPSGVADTPTLAALAEYRYDGLVLEAGDEGPAVEELQERLAGGPFDPGPPDGEYGTKMVQAVWALEKLAGVPVDGAWGPLDELAWQRLADGEIGGPERDHDVRWVEVDLSEQLMKVYDPGNPVPILISHASSGSGIPWENEDHRGNSITPLGDFHIDRRIDGWRESSLNIGRLYNPLYFNGGIAFHGATSVPLYPASHGCIRLPMHVADYLPGELPNGTPVHVLA